MSSRREGPTYNLDRNGNIQHLDRRKPLRPYFSWSKCLANETPKINCRLSLSGDTAFGRTRTHHSKFHHNVKLCHIHTNNKVSNTIKGLTTTSGRTSSQSQASILPVLANPVCISSAIINMLYFEQRSLTACR